MKKTGYELYIGAKQLNDTDRHTNTEKEKSLYKTDKWPLSNTKLFKL